MVRFLISLHQINNHNNPSHLDLRLPQIVKYKTSQQKQLLGTIATVTKSAKKKIMI